MVIDEASIVSYIFFIYLKQTHKSFFLNIFKILISKAF